MILVPYNVFWGRLIEDQGRKDSQQSLLNQSTGTSEPWELRGAVLRIPNFHFSEGPNVRGGS